MPCPKSGFITHYKQYNLISATLGWPIKHIVKQPATCSIPSLSLHHLETSLHSQAFPESFRVDENAESHSNGLPGAEGAGDPGTVPEKHPNMSHRKPTCSQPSCQQASWNYCI